MEHLITCSYVQHNEDFFYLSFGLAFIDLFWCAEYFHLGLFCVYQGMNS